MKHSKKSHRTAALTARLYTHEWNEVMCPVRLSTAITVLSACKAKVDVALMPNGVNMRAIDWLGKPVVLTLHGSDVKECVAQYAGAGIGGPKDDVVRALRHAWAARHEAGHSLPSGLFKRFA